MQGLGNLSGVAGVIGHRAQVVVHLQMVWVDGSESILDPKWLRTKMRRRHQGRGNVADVADLLAMDANYVLTCCMGLMLILHTSHLQHT